MHLKDWTKQHFKHNKSVCKQALWLAPAPPARKPITITIMQLIITSRNEIHMTVIDYHKGLYH